MSHWILFTDCLRADGEWKIKLPCPLAYRWSPDNLQPQAAAEELARIAQDPIRFLSEQVDREAKGPPVILPGGRTVPRLPGYARWIWDGEFCGVIGFRWQPGNLPPYCLGQVGLSVVPWKRQRGYATRALQLLLPQASLPSTAASAPMP